MTLAILCLSATVASASSLTALGFESGIATSTQWDGPADGWTSVTFQQTYNNPVVVAGIPSYVGGHEIIVSVKDVTSTGFKFHLHETACRDGGADRHLDEQISWLVAEEGTYTIGGRKFRVGKHANVASSTWTTVNFGSGFSGTPTILSQIQDASDDDYYVNLRHKNAGASSFEVYTQGTNAASGVARGDETVGYLVVEGGSGSSGSSKTFAAGVTTDVHTHVKRNIALGNDFGHANYAIFGNLHTSDGFDPVTLRYTTKSDDKTRIFLHEDTCGDSDTAHTTERVAWFALETGVLVYAGTCTNGALIAQQSRTQENHCGSCDPSFALMATGNPNGSTAPWCKRAECSHVTCEIKPIVVNDAKKDLIVWDLSGPHKIRVPRHNIMVVHHHNEENVCHKHTQIRYADGSWNERYTGPDMNGHQFNGAHCGLTDTTDHTSCKCFSSGLHPRGLLPYPNKGIQPQNLLFPEALPEHPQHAGDL